MEGPAESSASIPTSWGDESHPEPEIVPPEAVVVAEDTPDEFFVELVEDGDASTTNR